jgi:hypothetical protein
MACSWGGLRWKAAKAVVHCESITAEHALIDRLPALGLIEKLETAVADGLAALGA